MGKDVIIALDFDSREKTLAFLDRFTEEKPFVKVGHPAFAALESARITDPDRAKKYAEILLNQAMLIAGLPLENPSDYTDLICSLWK